MVALVLGFLLGHVLAGVRLSVPSRAGAMVCSGVRVDPNSRLRVTRIQVRVNLGLWFLVTGAKHQIAIQEIGEPNTGFFQLSINHRVGLVLVRWRNHGWIAIAEVSVSHALRQSVPFQDPIFDAPLDPLCPVLRSDAALQFCGECLGVAADMLQQTRVPNPMQIVRVTVEDDVPAIPTFVPIVLDMQRLVHVANEVDDELQGFCFRRPVYLRVFQEGEKLLCLADDAIAIRTFPCQVNLRSSPAGCR